MDKTTLAERNRALEAVRTIIITTVRSDAPDLTQRQMAVLLTLASKPDYGVKELAAELDVGKGPITRALDTLCREGFLQRRRNDDDARLVRLWVRPEGRAYLAALSDTIIGAFRPVDAQDTKAIEHPPAAR